MGHPVPICGSEVATAVAHQKREAMVDLLVTMLMFAPGPDAMRAFAQRHPDRWAMCIGLLAELGGYARR